MRCSFHIYRVASMGASDLGVVMVIAGVLGIRNGLWCVLGSVVSGGWWVLNWLMVMLWRSWYW